MPDPTTNFEQVYPMLTTAGMQDRQAYRLASLGYATPEYVEYWIGEARRRRENTDWLFRAIYGKWAMPKPVEPLPVTPTDTAAEVAELERRLAEEKRVKDERKARERRLYDAKFGRRA